MTPYDYAVLVFYFLYMLAISWVFRRFVTNVSDYFRGGGKAVWWMVGGSAFMVAFSAWTFTGAAGKAYVDGWPVAIIYVGNSLGFLINALHFAPKFRQLRVITAVEAIRQRFGRGSEQVFTWLQIPLGTLQAGIWLNALGVFFSAVFGLDLSATIIATGLVVLLMALVGGSWAVLASDFIQVLILMPVCLAVTVLALIRLGGVGGFLNQLPAAHLDPGQIFSADFLGLWCLAMILKQVNSTNNLFDASRYLCVKDSRHARWAGYLGAGLFLLGIVIWFVPPMAARALFPDLRPLFPQLKNPEEAAFIAISRAVMPVGMMGLLVSGIFAATMSSMDAGLNKNAGIFLKNFYQPHFCPHAEDRHLLKVGKFATVVLGFIVILVALKMSTLKGLGLFLLMQRVSILVGIPIIVPLLLGLMIRRTPPWSAWSTVLVGFVCSLFISDYLTPEWAARTFGVTGTLTAASREYWTQGIQFFGNVVIGTAWFVGTKLFWRRTDAAYQADIETFFVRLNTPVDFAREEGAQAANDDRQSRAIGWLCLAYGGFVILLAAIPNPLLGRLAFLGCGLLVSVIGWILVRQSQSVRKP
ncbi:MAG: transporter [Verrucomicrobia bacterium]|nr:transporter [Verrucomicrobiota bacterium]